MCCEFGWRGNLWIIPSNCNTLAVSMSLSPQIAQLLLITFIFYSSYSSPTICPVQPKSRIQYPIWNSDLHWGGEALREVVRLITVSLLNVHPSLTSSSPVHRFHPATPSRFITHDHPPTNSREKIHFLSATQRNAKDNNYHPPTRYHPNQ